MSRYQWPAGPHAREDRPLARDEHEALTNGVVLEEAVVNAHLARTEAPLDEEADFVAPKVAPKGAANLWVPIGPSTVLNGQSGDRPRVAGRVRDIAVSPEGNRAYAASANGGVWYTSDSGATWSPLGGWLPTPDAAAIIESSAELACGCLSVKFGPPDGTGDDAYVGTGELVPRRGLPGARQGGVGVLHLSDPLAAALGDPFGAHWKREAKNLTGWGIYRLARDPDDPNTMVAATSIGLFARTGAFVEDAVWNRVTKTPFNFTAADNKSTTDVLWVKTATEKRLYVAGPNDAVWTSTTGLANDFQKIDLSNVTPGGRLGLAVAPGNPAVVYALGKGPRLWRINGATATLIPGLPNDLFKSASDQSAYDLAIAVDPDNENVIMVGGGAVDTEAANLYDASLFKFTIGGPPGSPNAGFNAANQANPIADPSFSGRDVHPDVHQIVIVKTAAGTHAWVTCDGGVFRSEQAGANYTFVARNTGLAVLESDYVANHPTNDAYVLTGTKDTGLLMRVGDTLWMYSDAVGGDAGGVLFHPVKSKYFAAQYTNSDWNSNGKLSEPILRGTGGPSEKIENEKASFYAAGDIRRDAAGKVRLAIGTNRIWVTDDWDPEAASTNWKTLPHNIDPRAGAGNDEATDMYADGSGRIPVCLWLADDRLVALVRSSNSQGKNSSVLLYRNTGGTWTRTPLSEHSNKKSDYSNGDIDQPTSGYLPPLGSWSDVAVHDAGRGTGSFYVATTGAVTVDKDNVKEADRLDTLWWYDGTSKWYPTTLRSKGTKAPAYAVVCDPADQTKVYVGTGLGVWLGTGNFGGPTPTWEWQIFSNGLPEAAVEDLAFYSQGGVKLLRAAVKSRGVWEVDLSAAPGPTQRTFLRVHANDGRRVSPTVLANPMLIGPTGDWPWNASPDIRIRPAPLGAAEPIPRPAHLPWNAGTDDTYYLWILQCALRAGGDKLCRPNGIWTNQFGERLKAQNPAKGLNVDLARWNAIVTRPNAFATPWDGDPSEADLYELVVEDPPDPSEIPPSGPTPAPKVRRRKYKVDVTVHYRDLQPIPGGSVQVALLSRLLPANQAQWPTLGIAPAWKTAVEQLITGAAGAAWTPGDGWIAADSGSRVRSLTGGIDARTPRSVTFDVNFAATSVGQKYVLLAVVHSTADPVSAVSLTGNTLKDLVLQCHQVAVRTVRVVAGAV